MPVGRIVTRPARADPTSRTAGPRITMIRGNALCHDGRSALGIEPGDRAAVLAPSKPNSARPAPDAPTEPNPRRDERAGADRTQFWGARPLSGAEIARPKRTQSRFVRRRKGPSSVQGSRGAERTQFSGSSPPRRAKPTLKFGTHSVVFVPRNPASPRRPKRSQSAGSGRTPCRNEPNFGPRRCQTSPSSSSRRATSSRKASSVRRSRSSGRRPGSRSVISSAVPARSPSDRPRPSRARATIASNPNAEDARTARSASSAKADGSSDPRPSRRAAASAIARRASARRSRGAVLESGQFGGHDRSGPRVHPRDRRGPP